MDTYRLQELESNDSRGCSQQCIGPLLVRLRDPGSRCRLQPRVKRLLRQGRAPLEALGESASLWAGPESPKQIGLGLLDVA